VNVVPTSRGSLDKVSVIVVQITHVYRPSDGFWRSGRMMALLFG